MQIGRKGVQNLIVNIVFEKKTLKRHNFKKKPFHVFSFGNKVNKFQFGIF
jgi:hypothetical protein